jgi:hypothetical protein
MSRSSTRNESFFYIEKQGDKGAGRPFPLHPKSPQNRSSAPASDTFR